MNLDFYHLMMKSGTQTITSKSINVEMSMLMPMQIGVRTVKLSFYQDVTKVLNFKTLHHCLGSPIPPNALSLSDDLSLEIYVVRFVVSQWRLSLLNQFEYWSYFYRTRVRSLVMLVSNSLTH